MMRAHAVQRTLLKFCFCEDINLKHYYTSKHCYTIAPGDVKKKARYLFIMFVNMF